VIPRTPKALANFSPGLERSDNPGITTKWPLTLKGLGMCGINPFRVEKNGFVLPRVEATLGWN
jgi:hypothetical protein